MIRKTLWVLVMLPVAAALVALAVANRQTASISFDPFSDGDPAFVGHLPMYALIFILLIAGVVIGGVAAWLKQRRWRRRARRLTNELKGAREEIRELKRRSASAASSGRPGDGDGGERAGGGSLQRLPPPPRALPPAA